jgi:hypothetical protein
MRATIAVAALLATTAVAFASAPATGAPVPTRPVPAYTRTLDGSGDEAARAIAFDGRGNAYVAGETTSTDFPVTIAGRPREAAVAAFVAKLDRTGRVIWSRLLGGDGFSAARGIAVDAAGRAYVTGATNATDFPTTPSARQRSYGGGPFDAFVTALDASGAVAYSTFLGDTHYDEGNAIAVDRRGRAVVTGKTASPQFPRAGRLRPPVDGGAFVTKLSAHGSRLVFSTVLGGGDKGNHGNTGFAVTVDRAGATYAAGVTNAAAFPTVAALQPALAGGGDAFVTKIDAAGRSVIYSTYLGGSGDDSARGVAADSAGNAYVAGMTSSTDLPARNALQGSNAGGADAFVAKLDARGRRLPYLTYLGGSGEDGASAIAVTAHGVVSLTGRTESANFPLARGGRGGGGAFATRVGARGSGLPLSITLGGPASVGLGIAVDRFGRLAVAGRGGPGDDGAGFVTALAANPPARRAERPGGAAAGRGSSGAGSR